MKSADIIAHAERLRKTEVGMSNYTVVLNDAFVIIRELAENVAALEARLGETDVRHPRPDADKG